MYIASPHSHHLEHTLLCLKHGKHVLCEKAFALNSEEAEIMIAEAKKQNLFLMEALWPPFQPMYKKTKETLLSGEAGKLIHLNARFGFQAPFSATDRKFNLELGGGSLLDIGIYAVIDALWFMGVPDEIYAVASFAETGSEDSISIIFRYKDGRMANLYSSFRTAAGIGCDLLCEKGNILFSRARDMSQVLTVAINGEDKREYSLLPDGMGYQYEAEEVMKCLDEGRKESSVVPLSFSLDLMNTLDRIRDAAGQPPFILQSFQNPGVALRGPAFEAPAGPGVHDHEAAGGRAVRAEPLPGTLFHSLIPKKLEPRFLGGI